MNDQLFSGNLTLYSHVLGPKGLLTYIVANCAVGQFEVSVPCSRTKGADEDS